MMLTYKYAYCVAKAITLITQQCIVYRLLSIHKQKDSRHDTFAKPGRVPQITYACTCVCTCGDLLELLLNFYSQNTTIDITLMVC